MSKVALISCGSYDNSEGAKAGLGVYREREIEPAVNFNVSRPDGAIKIK